MLSWQLQCRHYLCALPEGRNSIGHQAHQGLAHTVGWLHLKMQSGKWVCESSGSMETSTTFLQTWRLQARFLSIVSRKRRDEWESLGLGIATVQTGPAVPPWERNLVRSLQSRRGSRQLGNYGALSPMLLRIHGGHWSDEDTKDLADQNSCLSCPYVPFYWADMRTGAAKVYTQSSSHCIGNSISSQLGEIFFPIPEDILQCLVIYIFF